MRVIMLRLIAKARKPGRLSSASSIRTIQVGSGSPSDQFILRNLPRNVPDSAEFPLFFALFRKSMQGLANSPGVHKMLENKGFSALRPSLLAKLLSELMQVRVLPGVHEQMDKSARRGIEPC